MILDSKLRVLQERYACIAEVRGKGLMVGVEMAFPDQVDALGQPLTNPQLAIIL